MGADEVVIGADDAALEDGKEVFRGVAVLVADRELAVVERRSVAEANSRPMPQ